MSDPTKNLKHLRDFGVQDYVLCDEEMQEFIFWFADNIDERNILTHNEIQEYNEMVKSGTALSDDDLARSLTEINSDYPNVLSKTNEDVIQLEKKLEHKLSVVESYQKLANHSQFAVDIANKTINDLQIEITAVQTDEQKMISSCFTAAKQLEDLQADNYLLLMKFNECYTKDYQQSSIFMYQMPLEKDFFKKCTIFSNALTVYMENKYKTKDFHNPDFSTIENDYDYDDKSKITNNTVYKQLNCIKEEFNELLNNNILSQMNIYATETHLKVCSTMMEIKTPSIITREIDEYNSNMTTIWMHNDNNAETIKLQVQELAEQEIEFIVAKNNNEKLRQAECRLIELKELADIVNNVLINADIIWCAMQFDLEKLKARRDFDKTDRLRKETVLSAKRMDVINSLVRGPSVQINLPDGGEFLREFQMLFADYIDFSNSPNNLLECFCEYEKLAKKIAIRLNDVIKQQHNSTSNEQFQKLKASEKSLKQLLYTGPIKKPSLENKDLVVKLYSHSVTLEQYQKNIKSIQMDLMEYNNRFRSDTFWRNKILLWMWFLMEPILIFNAIRDIKQKVNSMEERPINAPKMFAGLKRRT